MPRLYGHDYSRGELARRVGRLEQVAGVRLVTLGDGGGRGVRVLEFRTGSGFAFDVLVDRAFDIGRCELRGVPLAWTSGVGVEGPWFYEPDGLEVEFVAASGRTQARVTLRESDVRHVDDRDLIAVRPLQRAV